MMVKKTHFVWCAPLFACLIALSACSGQASEPEEAVTSAASEPTAPEADESEQEMADSAQEVDDDSEPSADGDDDSDTAEDADADGELSVPGDWPAFLPLPDATLVNVTEIDDGYGLGYHAEGPEPGLELLRALESDSRLEKTASTETDDYTNVTFEGEGYEINVVVAFDLPYPIVYKAEEE